MSWQVIQKSKITGIETVMAEVPTMEEATEALNLLWRSYVDTHYSAFVELSLKEIVYENQEAAEV